MWRQLGIWRTSNCVIERGVATPAIDPCMRAWDCIERMVNTHDWAEASTRRLKLREEKALLAKPGVAVGLQIGDDLRGRKVGRS
jgi:hypothetical protein